MTLKGNLIFKKRFNRVCSPCLFKCKQNYTTRTFISINHDLVKKLNCIMCYTNLKNKTVSSTKKFCSVEKCIVSSSTTSKY